MPRHGGSLHHSRQADRGIIIVCINTTIPGLIDMRTGRIILCRKALSMVQKLTICSAGKHGIDQMCYHIRAALLLSSQSVRTRCEREGDG